MPTIRRRTPSAPAVVATTIPARGLKMGAATPEQSTKNARRVTINGRRPGTADILARAAARQAAPVGGTTTSSKEAKQRAASKEIDAQLKLIAKAEADIDDAQRRITAAHALVEASLRDANMTIRTDGVYVAELAEQWTRQARAIDPKVFKNRVPNDVFWSCISVNLTRAAEHLSEKEMNEIADVVPSTLVGRVLKIKKIEARRRSKKAE